MAGIPTTIEVQRVAEIVVAKATRQRNKIKAKAIPIVIHQTQKGSLFSVKAKTTVKGNTEQWPGVGKRVPTRTHRRLKVAIKVTTSTPAQGNNMDPTVQAIVEERQFQRPFGFWR